MLMEMTALRKARSHTHAAEKPTDRIVIMRPIEGL